MYFLTSTVLAVGTYVVVYRGTWLREQGAGLTVLVGGGTFLAAQFARVLLMGLFGVQPAQTLGAASGAALDWVRAVAVALLSLVEAAALYLATTRVAGRRWLGSLPLRARATAVGFGYALAETVLLRVPYLWMHARSVDWDASSLCVALEAAAALARWCAVAALALPVGDAALRRRRAPLPALAALALAVALPELVHTLATHFLGGNAVLDCFVHFAVAIFAHFSASRLAPQ